LLDLFDGWVERITVFGCIRWDYRSIEEQVLVNLKGDMNEILCELQHIDKIFPGTQALNDVSFDIRPGEIHALIGTNGSGKSTLANILAGTFPQTAGEIIYKGEKVYFNHPSQAMKKGIILIHQELKLMSEMTVVENIYFGRFSNYKNFPVINWKEMNRKASNILQELGTHIDPTQKISKLSIAERQLVEIAKALSKQAKILIMDEPTASLTFEEVKMLFKVMNDLKKKGLAIIYISHRLEEILEISDRITVLEDSKLVTTIENTPELTKEHLVKLMIPKEKTHVSAKTKAKEANGPVVFSANNVCYSNKVKNFSFELKKGEVLGIAGLMGAGRTELLKCIFGALKTKSGDFYINGKPYKPKSPITALENRIALISEDRKAEGVILSMSIFDNMLFPNLARYSSGPVIRKAKATAKVRDQASMLNLRYDRLSTNVSSLSGGNQQKVVIGKWLMANSDIILMDEPTRGIDVGSKAEIYELVDTLSREGKSIIFVSSELEEVQKVSDRIVVMYNGQNVHEFSQNPTIEEMVRYATGTGSSN
jgi:ABC-type sugar transport system ATPase subunit